MPARQPCFTSPLPLHLGPSRATLLARHHSHLPIPNLPNTLYSFKSLSKSRRLQTIRKFTTPTSTAAPVSLPSEPLLPEEPDPESEPQPAPEIFHVTPEESGTRLDKSLASRLPTVSRSYLQTLLDLGHVQINGSVATSKSRKTAAGDVVQVRMVTPERELPITPEDIPLDILYEDDHIVAINKPAGMVVHPAPGNWTGTLVHALTFRYDSLRAIGGPRPGIVHRLDKGTSGVLLAGLTAEAQRGLMELFARRRVRKEYIAITVGNPAGSGCVSRTIDEPIGRCVTDRMRMAVVSEDSGGRRARSRVSVVGKDVRGLLHVCRVEIESGRTHQIRVHMRHVDAPVVGDEVYGIEHVNRRFRKAAGRTMLHAEGIGLEHPVTGNWMEVCAPVAEDMKMLVDKIGVRDLDGGEFRW